MIKTKLMGVVNVTPDSFYDGGKHFQQDQAVSHALKLAQDGADILDIGGESTRPGAKPVSIQEELHRVIPVVEAVKKKTDCLLSIDTRHHEVASAAILAGAAFINDISGFSDPQMREVAASSGAQVCVMHMQGIPATMQKKPDYPDGIIPHLTDWFQERISQLIKAGIAKDKIYLDPGIGFGKTVEHNLEILHNLQRLKAIGFPLLLGISRKSMISKLLNKPPESLLAATIALNTWVTLQGVDIIRVHDVLEHRDVVDLLHRI